MAAKGEQSLTDHLLASATGHFKWPSDAIIFHLPKGINCSSIIMHDKTHRTCRERIA